MEEGWGFDVTSCKRVENEKLVLTHIIVFLVDYYMIEFWQALSSLMQKVNLIVTFGILASSPMACGRFLMFP